MNSKTYLFNFVKDLKQLNFNQKLILSYIIKYHLLSEKKEGCFITKDIFKIIGNRSKNTTYLILKKLVKEQFIFLDKNKKRAYISEYTIALIDIAEKNNSIFEDLIKINDKILFDSDLNSIEKIILSIFTSIYEKYHKCFISNEKLAKLLQVTEVYISNIVSSLIKKKKIEARYIYKGYMRDKRFITILKDEYVPDYQI